jgi:putative transposase
MRLVVPGLPHHVTQRGNRSAEVFVDEIERTIYLSMLARYAKLYDTDVLAYCLMTNHIHLILVPRTKTGLAKTMRDASSAYAQLFNRRHAVSGHLWQARYFSSVMDEPYLWAALCYVERNPVRAGLVMKAEEYQWSSARAHCSLAQDPLLAPLPIDTSAVDWASFLANEDFLKSGVIRRQTHLGRPSGDLDFQSHVESVLNCSLAPHKRGRKRGWRKPK